MLIKHTSQINEVINMEIKIDAKCPRCGADLQLHHVSDVTNKPCKLEFMDKAFEIGKVSSLVAARRNLQPKKTDDVVIRSSAKHEVMEYFNNLFEDIAQAESKNELLALKKQLVKSKLKVKKNIKKEFKEDKADALKEIDSRLKSLSKKKSKKGLPFKDVSKKKDRKGLVYRGIFDEKTK